MSRVLIISDNQLILSRLMEQLKKNVPSSISDVKFDFAFSKFNKDLSSKYSLENWIRPVLIKDEVDSLITENDLIISLHCKQLFPAKLVNSVRCVNVHPGLNPFNRGWYPQVFSIINGLPSGVTIHEMDEELDHGPIIVQQEIPISESDTSLTVYNRILDAEIVLLMEHLPTIIEGKYNTMIPEEGNLNLRADFDKICELDLSEVDTFENHIKKLRALSHGEFANAFYRDKNGNKIYISVNIKGE